MTSDDLLRHGVDKTTSNLEPDERLANALLREYAAGSTIFEPGSTAPRILFIKHGWAICSKSLPSGTRIVTDFFLRGDMISTVSCALAQEAVEALSDVSVYEISDGLTDRTLNLPPQLSLIVIREMIKRQARMSERLTNMGRRDALGRTGHLLFELATRASEYSRPGLDGFECPLKQSDIGDAVGLSTVHINRVLKEMRLNGLLSFRSGVVEFLDRKRLKDVVDFDPGYLNMHID